MSAPRNPIETPTNAGAVPWPATTRSTMPRATVAAHTTTPVPGDSGRRHPASAQPAASPTANGHAVLANPVALSPWRWAERPIDTNSVTATASRARALRRGRVAACAGQPMRRPAPSQYGARILRLDSLPDMVLGSRSAKSTDFGHL